MGRTRALYILEKTRAKLLRASVCAGSLLFFAAAGYGISYGASDGSSGAGNTQSSTSQTSALDDFFKPSPQSLSGPKILHIVVKGNKRIDPQNIEQDMALHVGSSYTPEAADAAIQSLYNTGLFSNISLDFKGGTLYVSLEENPVVRLVIFVGNNKIESSELRKELTLKPRTFFTKTRVEDSIERILTLYRREGRFSVRVTPKLVRLKNNRVDVIFDISEGSKVLVRHISFTGNKNFADDQLRGVISTKEWAWWRFFSSDDRYDPDRLLYDNELLRRYYLQNGYPNFHVLGVTGDVSRDYKNFYVTFSVEEGDLYHFGDITLGEGSKRLKRKKLLSLIKTKKKAVYDALQIQNTTDALAYEAWLEGEPFLQVEPMIQTDDEKKTVSINYKLKEGPPVYIAKVRIVGNARTHDYVIRRALKFRSGDAYSKVVIDKSTYNLRVLNYFKTVSIDTEPTGNPKEVNLVVKVEEKPTGSLNFSLGASTLDGIFGSANVSENNLGGRGQQVGASVTLSSSNQYFSLFYTEPYLFKRHVGLNGSVFYSVNDLISESSYRSSSVGGSASVSFPLSERGNLSLSYRLTYDRIYDLQAGASAAVIAASGGNVRSVVGFQYYYDRRNDPFVPTAGWDFSWSENFAGLGGTLSYIKSQVTAHYYYKIYKGFVASFKADVAYIHGLWNDVNLNDRYFLGGNNFRGFDRSGIGPRDLQGGDALGAQFYAFGTAEMTFPNGLPASLGITTSIFTDFGYAGLADGAPATAVTKIAPRQSAGLSVYWRSPFGPVRFDFGKAIIKQSYDKTLFFSLNAGTTF